MYSTLIDFHSLKNGLDNPDWLIIDTRYDLMNKTAGRDAYAEGHIPGAVFLDVHDDLSGPPVTNRGRHPLPTAEEMNLLFSNLGITEKTQVIVYDNAFGAFAARLWWMLNYMQHPAVALLDGGWQGWTGQGGKVDTSMKELNESKFDQVPSIESVITIDDVEGQACLIDSREPARYRGELEPIDPVAGHIPGAQNRFWKENLSNSGQFKSKNELSSEFERVFDKTPSDETVVYCGSGVTACHNLLAAVHAGFAMPKLYAGSWSEWCNTPGKPIATEQD